MRMVSRIAIVCATLLAVAGCDKGSGGDGKKKAEPAAKKKAEPTAEKKGEPAPEKKGGEPAAKKEEPKKAEPAPTGEPVEVVLWHSYRGLEKEALNQVIKDYNGSQKEVTLRSIAVPYDPFVDKIMTVVPHGKGPDLFIFAHDRIGNFVEHDILEPLRAHVQPDVLKEFLPQAVKALVYRKNLYGLPMAFKSLVLFYNKKLLPEVPPTMEALIEKLKPLATEERHGFVYEAGLLYYHAPWIHAFGGQVFDADHKPAFATPEQAKALAYARSLHAEHKVLPRGVGGFMVTSLFNDGNAVCVMNGSWFRAEIESGVDYGVTTIPTVAGQTPKPFLGIEAVFLTKTGEKKKAAVKAALYLTGGQSARVRVTRGKQPVAHQAALDEGAAADPLIDVFKRQAENAELMDASPEMKIIWSTADSAIAKGIFGADSKPADELAAAHKKMLLDIDKSQRGN